MKVLGGGRQINLFYWVFILILLSPVLALLTLPQTQIEVASELLNESFVNTFILSLSVLFLTTLIGTLFSFLFLSVFSFSIFAELKNT